MSEILSLRINSILSFAVLHELVHAIQYDGRGTAPTWLTESIADFVRLQAQLGPAHWRHPGQGSKEKGWEDGYDAGAQFLSWLVGATGVEVDDIATLRTTLQPTPTAPILTSSSVPAPQSTQYPTDPRPPQPAPEPKKGRPRPGPWPDFVRRLDANLEHNKYTESCWTELTGYQGGLPGLWAAYLGHYV